MDDKFIIVTGGAGFIGSHIVEELNRQGYDNIIIIDDFADGNKLLNLKNLNFYDMININESDNFYLDEMQLDFFKNADIVFNEGAISSTTESDGNKLLKNNIYAPLSIIGSMRSDCVFSHASSASVYGDSAKFKVSPKYENPINAYAMTKYMVDNEIREFLRQNEHVLIQSWRYFNVYGERENHKGSMRSMVTKFIDDKPAKIFKNSKNVSRDFVYVKDVAKIKVWAALELYEANKNEDHKKIQSLNGIFNLGTGTATNVQEIADKIKEVNKKCFKEVAFPEELIGKYQFYTQADMSKTPLPKKFKFTTVSEYIDIAFNKGVDNIVRQLQPMPNDPNLKLTTSGDIE